MIHVVKFVEVQRVSNGYVVTFSTDVPGKRRFIAKSANEAAAVMQDALEHGLALTEEEEGRK